MPPQAAMWHKGPMRLWFRAGLAVFLLLLADAALAGPRLERERCVFKPPRGDKIECHTLIVPENRAQPQNGRDVHLKVAIRKAKCPSATEQRVYRAAGPGHAPLIASTAGADPLAEGDWWNDTATIRRRRDVIIISQRGAGGSTPNLDCFEPRTSEPARAKRRAITEPQERDILLRCRADLDRRKIDLAQYGTPALADDVADLVKALGLGKVNLYGISYGTRWALETMRRHPNIIRSAVLDGAYPPQVNGEQNEPEIVRNAFEQLFADCASDKLCRERNPDLAANVKAALEQADRTPIELVLQLDDRQQRVKLAAYCRGWRVPTAPRAERQPVTAPIPTLLLSGGYDWLTPSTWGREAARKLPEARHVVFRALGHGVSSQDACAARLRDEFID